ncbi:TOPRIM nucleotidyl transferase/hydrolase domain-containing protein [Nocardioides dilutus]
MTASVVLVEGPSDAAVLGVLGRRLGLGSPHVVPMGGITNVGRLLRAYAERPGTAVSGLCDRGEVRFVAGALRRLGREAEDGASLAAHGFFVCAEDLEDELLRALGTDAVVEVIEREGELGRLRTFQQQPYQRTRSLHEQLHRFAGTRSGRKVRLAAALAEELDLGAVPPPLLGVLEHAASLSRGRGYR